MAEEKTNRLGLLGTVSMRLGGCIGTVAAVGMRIHDTTKTLLTRPVNDCAFVTDEQAEIAPETPAVLPKNKNTAFREKALTNRIMALETDIVEARSQLAETQSNAKNAELQSELQLSELRDQKDSLTFDLEQTTKETKNLKSSETALRARVAALESELNAAKGESENEEAAFREKELTNRIKTLETGITEARSQLAETQSNAKDAERQFKLQLNELREQKESLASDLEQATEKTKDIKNSETDLRERVAVLESELDEAKSEPINVSRPIIHAKPQFLSETVIEKEEKVEVATEEPLPSPQISEFDIPVPQDVDFIETKQTDLPEQEQEETETEGLPPVIAEHETSIPDVTTEQVQAAVFDSEAKRIIFVKALSDMDNYDEAIRIDATKAMAGIHHELSVRALVALMAKEPSPKVRQECINALASLDMKEALPALKDALTEQDASVRLAAVRGLYRLDGDQIAPSLIRMLCDESEEIRRMTATCIGWLGKEELAVELIPLLDDRAVSVRRSAVEAMKNLRNCQVVSELIEHLNDTEEIIHKAIIVALETITGKKMSGSFPKSKKARQILIIRWREWWKEEQKIRSFA